VFRKDHDPDLLDTLPIAKNRTRSRTAINPPPNDQKRPTHARPSDQIQPSMGEERTTVARNHDVPRCL
jgi:hypothetical protein